MVDDMVGKIMKALEDAGIDKNTILVFSTDNGCSPEAKFENFRQKGIIPVMFTVDIKRTCLMAVTVSVCC